METATSIDIGSDKDATAVVCCNTAGVGSRPGCQEGTYADAVAHCASQGLQLCTADQIRGGAGQGTGCGFDATPVWTSTTCSMCLLCIKGGAVEQPI